MVRETNTYGIALSLTSCLGFADNAAGLLGLVTFEVRITGGEPVFMWLVILAEVTFECVVIVGDTGWDGMLLVDKLEGTLCCVLFCIRGWDVTFEGIVWWFWLPSSFACRAGADTFGYPPPALWYVGIATPAVAYANLQKKGGILNTFSFAVKYTAPFYLSKHKDASQSDPIILNIFIFPCCYSSYQRTTPRV